MGIFGWSYPPGCHSVPGDEDDGPCLVCGQSEEDCICPECPECGSVGSPECYEKHGMVRTEEQVRLLNEAEARWAADAKAEAEGEEKLRKELDEYYAEMEKDLAK